MSRARRIGAVYRMVRNMPLATSIVWRHLGRDTTHAMSIGLRALPARIRRQLANQGGTGAFAALALSADGRRDEALRKLDEITVSAGSRALGRAVAVAAALDAPDEADRLLNRLEVSGLRATRLAALVAAREGELGRAAELANRAGFAGRRLHARLTGEIASLTPNEADLGVPRSRTPTLDVVSNRVLHLVTNALPEATAGYTVRTHGIARAECAIGLDAHVATRLGFPVTKGKLAAGPRADIDDVPYHRMLPLSWLPSREDRALRADIDATTKLVRALRPAVLHAHSKHINAQVALAVRKRFEIPVVYEVRGFLEETWRSRGRNHETDNYRLAREAETRCMQAADMVVTLAEVMRNEIIERGVPGDRVVVVPNAVDERFLDPAPDPVELRQGLGIGENEVTVGLVSTLNTYEGVDTLVDAVALLRGRGIPVRLLVVGDGPAAAGLKEQAAALGISDACIFTGRVPFDQVRVYHSALDVFCTPRADLPVCRLVTPLKPLEALATGRPVVASDLPPLREMVDDGRTGALVPAGDALAWADRLEPLLADHELRAKMGSAGRSWVAEQRTWAVAAQRYQEVYERIAPTVTLRRG